MKEVALRQLLIGDEHFVSLLPARREERSLFDMQQVRTRFPEFVIAYHTVLNPLRRLERCVRMMPSVEMRRVRLGKDNRIADCVRDFATHADRIVQQIVDTSQRHHVGVDVEAAEQQQCLDACDVGFMFAMVDLVAVDCGRWFAHNRVEFGVGSVNGSGRLFVRRFCNEAEGEIAQSYTEAA